MGVLISNINAGDLTRVFSEEGKLIGLYVGTDPQNLADPLFSPRPGPAKNPSGDVGQVSFNQRFYHGGAVGIESVPADTSIASGPAMRFSSTFAETESFAAFRPIRNYVQRGLAHFLLEETKRQLMTTGMAGVAGVESLPSIGYANPWSARQAAELLDRAKLPDEAILREAFGEVVEDRLFGRLVTRLKDAIKYLRDNPEVTARIVKFILSMLILFIV